MKRSLGFWRAWALVVGTMIGSGVFMLPAVLAPYGLFSVGGWLLTACGALLLALTLGSLARRLPRIGGPYAYTRAAFGEWPGFLVGWGYWIALWSAVAAIAVAISGYFGVFFPVFSTNPVVGALGSMATIWLFVAINLLGVRSASIVQLVTAVLKLLPLVVIGAAGLWLGQPGDIPATNPDEQPVALLFAGLVVLTMWAFIGIEAATIPADDVIEPERTIPRALLAGTVAATIVYVLATTGVMAVIPSTELAQSSAPFADAAKIVFGAAGAFIIAAGAVISIAGALNGNLLLAGQMLRGIAGDGAMPAYFARLNGNGAPAAALVFSAALSSLLIIMNYSKGLVAAFETMILLSTLTTLVPYAASAAAEIVLQTRSKEEGVRWRSVAIASGALAFAVFAIVGAGWEVFVYGLVLFGAGLPVRWLVARATPKSD